MTGSRDPTRVLIVDDEPLMRWSLAETLADHGCEVVEAPDAHSAAEIVHSGCKPPDVVFLDLYLPDASDFELLSEIRRSAPRSKVILISAYATPDIALEARARGASAVLLKPFDMPAVLGFIDEQPFAA